MNNELNKSVPDLEDDHDIHPLRTGADDHEAKSPWISEEYCHVQMQKKGVPCWHPLLIGGILLAS
jgi:hypothetical protein